MMLSSIEVYNASPADRLPAVSEYLDIVAGQQVDVVNGNPILINSSYEHPFQMMKKEFNQIATGVIGLAFGESLTGKSTGSFFKKPIPKTRQLK